MKWIVYLDPEECIICTPETEQETVRFAFGEHAWCRDIKTYQRIELDGNHLYCGAYTDGYRSGAERWGVEANKGELHVAKTPLGVIPSSPTTTKGIWARVVSAFS